MKRDMMAASSLRKVLVIVGTTGAGKTKLSIDLAKAVGGEIINSDAMQMYRGLDIATAKVTEQEKEGIPHHLFDIVDPSDRCDVNEYKQLALHTIDDILARGKVPIIVGGTMYYTQSILWRSQLMDDVPIRPNAPVIEEGASPEEVFAKLREVDPVMASRWHVNQVRRVRRSLEVYYQTGIPHSEHIARQAANNANMDRYYDSCAFWVHCSKSVLADRLAKRVDKMMDTGLVDEIKQLREQVRLNPPQHPGDARGQSDKDGGGDDDDDENDGSDSAIQYQAGILQAIGYKEFAPYLDAFEARGTTTESDPDDVAANGDQTQKPRNDDEAASLLKTCVEQLNVATRQYARRQLSWIRNRFVTRNIPVYQVDSSDVSKWDELVATPAVTIARSFLAGEAITEYKTLQDTEPDKYQPVSHDDKYKEHICEACGDRKFVGKSQWEMHVRSKGHKFHLKRVELEKNPPAWRQERQERQASKQLENKSVPLNENGEGTSNEPVPKRAKTAIEVEKTSKEA